MSRWSGARGFAADPGPARSRGQATVELAMLLPVIAVVALAVVQELVGSEKADELAQAMVCP